MAYKLGYTMIDDTVWQFTEELASLREKEEEVWIFTDVVQVPARHY